MNRSSNRLLITEITDRSSDGRTLPFKCRAEDGDLYYVKGRSASHHSLICEWMAGHLALAFGLNLPNFAIAIAPAALVRLHPEGKDLGTSPVFASKAVEQLSWLTYASKDSIPLQVRRDVAVFDWWVHNADRSLSDKGGNPNLLFDTNTAEMVVIDHNLAFDPDFTQEAFLTTHVFNAEWRDLCQDLVEMANYRTRLNQALASAWDQAWQQVPEEWLFHDDEQSIPVEFDAVACKQLLERCDHQDFWRTA